MDRGPCRSRSRIDRGRLTLQQLQFESANGALIDVPGQRQGQTGNFTVDVADQTTATFTIRQAAGGQPATVPLTVVDSCGPWHTFVGGGPAAFVPPTVVGPTVTPTRTLTPVPAGKTAATLSVDLGSTNQQVLGGQTVAVYWSGIANPGTNDQIGLYLTRDEAPQNNRLPPDTPLLTNGTASGNANVVINNDALDALSGAQSNDMFEFILYRAGAGTTRPSSSEATPSRSCATRLPTSRAWRGRPGAPTRSSAPRPSARPSFRRPPSRRARRAPSQRPVRNCPPQRRPPHRPSRCSATCSCRR